MEQQQQIENNPVLKAFMNKEKAENLSPIKHNDLENDGNEKNLDH